MRFLIDAQLPRRLAHFLNSREHDAIHTLDLPRGNRTSDIEIIDICARENRLLVTKTRRFTTSFLLRGEPSRLLLISTGNITNREFEALFTAHLEDVVDAFRSSKFVELDRNGITIQG